MVFLNPIRLTVKVNPHRVYGLTLVAEKQSLLAGSWAFLPQGWARLSRTAPCEVMTLRRP